MNHNNRKGAFDYCDQTERTLINYLPYIQRTKTGHSPTSTHRWSYSVGGDKFTNCVNQHKLRTQTVINALYNVLTAAVASIHLGRQLVTAAFSLF